MRDPFAEFWPLWSETLQWQPDPALAARWAQLYDVIVAGNQKLNLTRITSPADFWEKHLWDSLVGIQPWLIAPELPTFQVVDIGTGGGFPGLPVALTCDPWSLTLLDSTQKKIAFLETAIADLHLPRTRTRVGRAETLGRDPDLRDRCDLALIRAVGPAAVCAEYALPMVKPGGMAVLYRGHWSAEETAALAAIAPQLGATLDRVLPWTTPLTQGQRHCIYLKKTQATPKAYPRAIGIPSQHPLTGEV